MFNEIPNRVAQLRLFLQQRGLQACVIPTADPHASEYIASHWHARQYFSGFTGSAGTLIVAAEAVGLWTDSRYWLQAELELAGSGIALFRVGEEGVPAPAQWLSETLERGSRVAMLPELFSVEDMRKYQAKLSAYQISIETECDFISALWEGRPALSNEPFFVFDEKYAGKNTREKLAGIRQTMQRQNAEILLLNVLDEIAWLFNIRGNDVAYNPVVTAFAAVETERVLLFVAPEKLTAETKKYFFENEILLKDYDGFSEYLCLLHEKTVWLDEQKMNFAAYEMVVHRNKILSEPSPVLLAKSVKNSTEIDGMRLAMEKDGAALTRFWLWFETAMNRNGEKYVVLTELSLAEKLREFRAEQEDFSGESFAPIVGFAAHGAIVHYSATAATDSEICPESFLLIDSGAQFLHGTTDITRTFALGKLSNRQRRDYTLVLKGHIALAQAVFPAGTRGTQLDALARQFLWRDGLNYGHGTGHGVGCFLGVHEGPQSISPRENPVALQAGMIVSNEPGLYREGEYGIRLENLVLVKKCDFLEKQDFFCFETLTLLPFDQRAIDYSLLGDDELEWINNYHRVVFERLSPRLSAVEQDFLKEKTKRIDLCGNEKI
ncbi:MAG: aminopeptidase P family protein [Prevotellaceae bacterium]|nr:aminopeptidase P family protein [Prevotellaceae bacterium]